MLSNRPAAAGRHSSQRMQFQRRIPFVMRGKRIWFSNALGDRVPPMKRMYFALSQRRWIGRSEGDAKVIAAGAFNSI